uniref:Oligopeptide transporter n=1 Tax=Percolomonas cosmopolitus TaxID=63605 RepID=A0A7S1PFN5_9EUKA|mmetsp:Transcript_4039/g.15210  ORF Transcript_4039/g.15210 Transcript_4039/m.15210 type:complete len:704 (+) Transcript_4039:248-2359(+)|eukprot:CAMPEP_0117441982 /NCGR_PEP_ID=MMETSP0759-20121206/3914_1 /TAXON_ID=63605 /ORGANISM="Percolomonas cosmopolitus, Strain WS" /LENGTH=703 /DNA_ID=CAMNT_0005233851 /DNA_START=225 /DNA_END=2336 /DNA_ORIENTATION=+
MPAPKSSSADDRDYVALDSAVIDTTDPSINMETTENPNTDSPFEQQFYGSDSETSQTNELEQSLLNKEQRHSRSLNSEDGHQQDGYSSALPIRRMIELDIYKNRGEFTLRALILGILIGALVAAVNVNFGLRVGWTSGGGILAVVVVVAVMRIINPDIPFTKQETVIAVTAASSAGTMTSTAGLVSSIPALKLLGVDYSTFQLVMWGLSVAFFGVYFAVPLRKQMIVVEKLEFPSGRAASETIHALFAKGAETVKKAQVLMTVAVFSSLWAVTNYFIPWIEDPPFPRALGLWGFRPHINPLLMGGGMLSGFRACVSLLMGAIVGWGIFSPIAYHNLWTPEQTVMGFKGSRGWILWMGVAAMTAEALISLLFTIPIMIQGCVGVGKRLRSILSYTSSVNYDDQATPEERLSTRDHMIPWYWWVGGILLSTVMLSFIGHLGFALKFYFIWIAIPLSFLLSVVAVRCVGSTDINPVGGVGKVTQLVYAGLAPGQVHTNLLSAGIIAAGASQAGDMMQDLKIGYLHNVSPRSQFFTQLIGICAGLMCAVPIYKLYDLAYHVGDDIPAPAAHAWKAVAEVLSKGLTNLPKYSAWGALGGFIFGALLATTHNTVKLVPKLRKFADFIPSALAFGIGMIVPPKQSLAMFAGSVIVIVWRLVSVQNHKHYFFAVSSGLIAGEGLVGILIALLKLMGANPLIKPWTYEEAEA